MNEFKVNSLATLVAVRAAESAPYFTVGSKKYFSDQLVGKRNGQTYRFVLKDTGEAVNRLGIDDTDDTSINEREVSLTLDPWHVAVETNAIEAVTDVDWDPEIAEPNGQKLANAAVRKVVNSDLGKCGTAFVGSGFAPLSQASAHLASIVNEELYGFCDPNVEAILTSNGQQFVPVNAPDMYSKGLLGKFHGAEYRAQRFMPNVTIKQALVDEFDAGVTVDSYVDNGDGTATLTLTGVTESIKKATPLWIEGVMATDTVGDPTTQEHVFIALEDATAGVVKVRAVAMDQNGNREVAAEDGTAITADLMAGKSVATADAGKYYTGIVRANGAFEFETLDKLDAAGADYKKDTASGLTIHENRLVDLKTMQNITRWDLVTLAGIVESRAVSAFYVK